MPSYADLLRFYVDKMQRPVQSSPPVISYGELQAFYEQHTGLGFTSVPPRMPIRSPEPEPEDLYLTEDDIVTKEEAKEAFASVQTGFANVGEEQGRIK